MAPDLLKLDKIEDSYYHGIVESLRTTFKTGKTLPYAFRIEQLRKLLQMLETHEAEIVNALQKDLKRPNFESQMYDTLSVKIEVNGAIKDLKTWIKPKFNAFNALVPFDTAFMKSEPFGVALIIGAWNYPMVLTLRPLVGAIAAGNCAVIKPSEICPCSAAILSELIPRYLDTACFRVIEGGVHETTLLLNEHFDFIFATCSTQVGKIVMSASVKNLTPITLELGGKSPVYIDESADLETSVRRIMWGKFINAGETCIAPDYILCTKRIENQFLSLANKYLCELYGSELKSSPSLSRIVNIRHFRRLQTILDGTKGNIVAGGQCDENDLWIPPTFIVNVNEKDACMQEEIFGPILPFITVETPEEAFEFIQSRPGKPLALYVFAKKRKVIDLFTEKSTSGSMCVNDVVMQFAMPGLEFGGVGTSGMGKYIGKGSFDCFSHKKSVLIRDFSWITETLNTLRYPPYVHLEFKVGVTYFLFKHFQKFNMSFFRLSHILMFLLGMLVSYLIFK